MVTVTTGEMERQKRTLRIVFGLNLMLFVSLGLAGLIGDSSALIANAIDNLSDTVVYAISWMAVGKSPSLKRGAAKFSGIMLIAFAGLVMLDAVRRAFLGAEPIGPVMIIMAAVAAAVNLWCLQLLKSLKTKDVNLKAAQTFSANDFISNGGIVVAGALVWWTGSVVPDVLVGMGVALLAFFGGLEILSNANKQTKRRHD